MDLSVIFRERIKDRILLRWVLRTPGFNMVAYPGLNFKVFGGFPACFCCVRHLGGINMSFLQKIRLIFECFRLAGGFGLIAGVKYALGLLSLEETVPESSVFAVGGQDA